MATKLNKAGLLLVGKDIEKAVEAVAAKHGITITYAGGNYTPDGSWGDVKLHAQKIAAEGEILGKEADAFKANADLLDINPDALGKTFEQGGKTYRIIGLKGRKVVANLIPSKLNYLFSSDFVALKFPREKAEWEKNAVETKGLLR